MQLLPPQAEKTLILDLIHSFSRLKLISPDSLPSSRSGDDVISSPQPLRTSEEQNVNTALQQLIKLQCFASSALSRKEVFHLIVLFHRQAENHPRQPVLTEQLGRDRQMCSHIKKKVSGETLPSPQNTHLFFLYQFQKKKHHFGEACQRQTDSKCLFFPQMNFVAQC